MSLHSLILIPFLLFLLPFSALCETRITVLGDSLTAGYGLAADDAFPARLGNSLRTAGHAVTVINAGVSGDTTAGGRARLDWLLADRPDALIVELGGNDALRGLDPEQTRANLAAILERLQQERIPVLLAGMRAPRNLGREYTAEFDRIFPELAEHYDLLFYPFFLDGVVGSPQLNQADGIHPNAQGVAVI
ncbi:MAG: arylesterase, partial [Desulfuromonas sp.]